MRSILGITCVVLFTASVSGQTPVVFDSGVVNAASFAPGQAVTPGSVVAIFGTDFASQLSQASSVPLSTSLNDVSVTFNGIPAPLFAVIPQGPSNPAQINAQLPWDVLPQGQQQGTVQVVVIRNSVSSAPKNVPVAPFGPGIFAIGLNSGQLVGIAIIATGPDYPLAGPLNGIPGGYPMRPARVGEVLQILATGLGPLDLPPPPNGDDSHDALRRNTTLPTVLFGGVPAQPDFSGMAPTLVGVNQINVVVPANAPKGSAVPLQIQTGGITSSVQVTIAVE